MKHLLPALLILGLIPAAGAGTASRASRTSRSKSGTRSTWRQPTYADSTVGDSVDGEDLTIRRAAVDALGRYNGSVVVVDPTNGRILALVNQKLALKSGFQPCSTIKLVTAFAALSESLIEKNTPYRLSRRMSLNLISALAHSNNGYFALLGNKLGFQRVCHYARMFGLGEKAGLGIDGEQPGGLPKAPPENGGVGMMTSFGEGISLTPLQLAALLSAISNGGTLYYLQYPRSQRDIENFTPMVKRELDIAPWVPDVKSGMRAVVDIGTGRRAGYDPNEPVLGKTGTCTDYRVATHMGWFGSFNDVERNKLVVVVMLTGGKSVNGPVAAGVAGAVYRNLSEQRYFAGTIGDSLPALYSTQACCAR